MASIRARLFIRVVVAYCLYYSGFFFLLIWIRRRILRRKGVCVLGLHRVLPDHQTTTVSLPGMVIRESTFATMLSFLQAHFTVVSLDQFIEGETPHGNPFRPLCLITFDDGWKDNFTHALPCLTKVGLPAVIFLVTGMAGRRGGFWVEQLSHSWGNETRRLADQAQLRAMLGREAPNLEEAVEALKHMPAASRTRIMEAMGIEPAGSDIESGEAILNWEEIRAMEKAGISCEAHTDTHPLLVYEDDATVTQELQKSKSRIERELGKKVRAFAYPNGAWDGRVRGMVENAGFERAFTTQPGWYSFGSDPYAIPRIMLHEGKITGPSGRFSPAMFCFSLTGWR